jgi:hypothetical protein
MSFWERPCAAEGHQVGKARRRRQDVVVGAVEARRRRVSPPDLHVPVRPAKLHPPCTLHLSLSTVMSLRVGHAILTMTTLSLAAMARMSAQDTTSVLTASMTSKPLTESLLGFAIFSPWKLGVQQQRRVTSLRATATRHIPASNNLLELLG